MEKQIAEGLAALGIPLPSPEAPAQLAEYGRLLIEKNQVMNLTAITEPSQVAALHFLDSAALLGAAEFRNKRVIDVGTGGGFPGLPLRLLEPSMRLTLLDSLGKRVDWLSELCCALRAEGVACIHARAEEQALVPGFRDSFDIATSRAVADLRLLCELCLPYVAVGGKFLAMKSVDSDAEVEGARNAIGMLGGRLLAPYDYAIPGTEIRHRVVVIEKIAHTPKALPRRWAKIKTAPL
ncbi:MAG: 16S rRNA (guanine(527)-N(7))-methyltransferase RsmG [Pseudoflavonifractor sp.]